MALAGPGRRDGVNSRCISVAAARCPWRHRRPGCSPQPCAAPGGFEADFSQIGLGAGRVSVQVRFRNHTQGELLDAVSYRHTSPVDFALRIGDGRTLAPIFAADCPGWEEVRVERGSTVGPEKLCFHNPTNGLRGASMIWSPDLGLLFRQVSIPLG